MLPSWCVDAVTVLRAAKVVRGGRELPDWANAESHELAGCSLQGASTETEFDGAQRDASLSRATLLCPAGSDVSQGDRVSFQGRTWLVDGVPMEVRSPTGAVSHMRAPLVEWRG
ncbi:MAG: hypothetical protein IJ092_06925 [Atopobiaceae bacterium]|nr:hypothetical protein [Atopobiaceae bacterium]